MKLIKTTLATGIAAALALGVAGQANASVYASSSLQIRDFKVEHHCAVLGQSDPVVRVQPHQHRDPEWFERRSVRQLLGRLDVEQLRRHSFAGCSPCERAGRFDPPCEQRFLVFRSGREYVREL